MTQPDWSARVVRVVAGEVRRHRRARGMSTRTVAEACAQLGHPIPRSVLANLEVGRRETVTVPELFVLAAVLGVPPTDLLVPLASGDQVEPLPGVSVSPPVALDWVVGSRTLPGVEWQSNNTALYHLHREMVERWLNAKAAARHCRERGDEEGAVVGEEDADAALVTVAETRAAMRERGLTLPDLPPELARARAKL